MTLDPDNLAFNWRLYLQYNDDLTRANMTTEQQAARHWMLHGKLENRIHCQAQVSAMLHRRHTRSTIRDLGIFAEKSPLRHKRVALIFYGLIRYDPSTINSVRYNILEVLRAHGVDYESFCHAYDQIGAANRNVALYACMLGQTAYRIETQHATTDQVRVRKFAMHGDARDDQFLSLRILMRQLNSLRHATAMWESRRHMYDAVIYLRSDTVLEDQLDMFALQWVVEGRNSREGRCVTPLWQRDGRINDRFAMGTPNVMQRYGYCLKPALNYSHSQIYHAEKNLRSILRSTPMRYTSQFMRRIRSNSKSHPKIFGESRIPCDVLHNVFVLLLCFNEDAIISQTIEYYKSIFPTATIIVYDNYSTDRSRELATRAGAFVVPFGHADRKDNYANINVKNEEWKTLPSPSWVFCLDMDEHVKITADQLYSEQCNKVSVIQTTGYQMVADLDHNHVRLSEIRHGMHDYMMSKPVAFHTAAISDISFALGAHTCNPKGDVVYSKRRYPMYHFKYIGLEYLSKNHRINHARTSEQRLLYPGSSTHYTNENRLLEKRYKCLRRIATRMPDINDHTGSDEDYPKPYFDKQTASTKSGLDNIIRYVEEESQIFES